MTVERSQEAVEAAEASFMAACKFNADAKTTGGVGVTVTARKMTEDALAAADAVDPCVPVRVLHEWVEAHSDLALAMYRDTKFGAAEQGAVLGVLSALAAWLDEHANERTD